MNVAFIETTTNGVTALRATLTMCERGAVERQLLPDERLESFLYAPTAERAWPCGPSVDDWRYFLGEAYKKPRLRRVLEGALAASRHRYLATATPETLAKT
jgi:hypothetical protein